MNDFLKKMGLVSLGLISFTEKELSVLFGKLVEEGRLNEPEAKRMMSEFKTSGEKYWNKYIKDIEKKAESTVKSVIAKVEGPAKREISNLKKKIAKLQKCMK